MHVVIFKGALLHDAKLVHYSGKFFKMKKTGLCRFFLFNPKIMRITTLSEYDISNYDNW